MAKLRSDRDLKFIIKETIAELINDEEFIQRIVKKVSDKMQEKLQAAEVKIKMLECKTNSFEEQITHLQQKEKVKNICIYGIVETEQESLKTVVTKILNDNTGLNIKEIDIASCYRIGNVSSNKKKYRPVIIKFVEYDYKNSVINNAKRFKGKKIFITEDLVQARRDLLKNAQAKLGIKNVWPRNGFIFTKCDGKTVKIKCLEDINNIENLLPNS